MFTVESFPAPELGNASFLVSDPDRRVALVIDPLRDVDAYLSRAETLGVKIARSLDTHLHNDFVSGRRELSAEAGTDITELGPDDEVSLGEATLRAIHTPGHTPDHLSYLLLEGDRPRSSQGAQ
jgi:hydroxyacylglutathione hydrolase